MMLALKSSPQIAAKVGNPAGFLCRRIWYSVGKSGVLGITEYRQGRPLSGILRYGYSIWDSEVWLFYRLYAHKIVTCVKQNNIIIFLYDLMLHILINKILHVNIME